MKPWTSLIGVVHGVTGDWFVRSASPSFLVSSWRDPTCCMYLTLFVLSVSNNMFVSPCECVRNQQRAHRQSHKSKHSPIRGVRHISAWILSFWYLANHVCLVACRSDLYSLTWMAWAPGPHSTHDFLLFVFPDCTSIASRGLKKVCKSCRSRQGLSNDYLLAKIRFDTAENELLKVCQKIAKS